MSTDSEQQARRTVRVEIKRQDGPESAPRWEAFEVGFAPGTHLNVTSVLQYICAEPVMADGTRTTPVAYQVACLEEVCGSCTMVINGHVRQGCSQLIDDLIAEREPITIEPMSKFPLVRDLIVDRSRLFEDLKQVRGWVPTDSTLAVGGGPKESPANQRVRYEMSRCMSCGCCLEACPQYTYDNDFLGAAVIGQVRYFNRHETGKQLAGERLDAMMGPGGVVDCGNAQNCVKVCPKDIPLTEAIAEVGRDTTKHAVRKFFTE